MKKYKYRIRKCKSCNTDFRPLKKNQIHCTMKCRMVLSKCKYCDKDFYYHYLKPKIYCSKKCAGLNNRIDKKTVKCINCNDNIKVYYHNTDTKYCNRKCKDEYQKIMFIGENNPNYGNSKLKGVKRTQKDILKIKKGIKKSWDNPNRLVKYYEAIDRFKENYGYFPMQSPESRLKASNTLIEGYSNGKYKTVTHGKCGNYVSIKTGIEEWYQSSYELVRMIELDEDKTVEHWTKKHKIRIKLNEKNWYIPDFLITYINGDKILEEVKGYVRNKKLFDLQVEMSNKYIKLNNIKEYKVNFMNHLM